MQRRHSYVIFTVMLIFMACTIIWTVHFDTLKPNPGLTSHNARTFEISNPALPMEIISIPAIAALPVDQHLGKFEGKEMRFGTSAGATFAALTTDVTCGAVNAEADSLKSSGGIVSHGGHVVKLFFWGKRRWDDQYVVVTSVIGIFLAGMMVGRTPEYLGKKIGGREVKLAIIALLIHPLYDFNANRFFCCNALGS